MKALHNTFLLLLSASLVTADVRIGDQVCMTGFIMDNFCIERGTLLDNRRVTTLQNPELHSYHCLLDLTPCINSGYQVLGNKDPGSGLYCPGLRIDNTNEVLRVGRAHGTSLSRPGFFTCSQCDGPDENPIAGYQATIIGTVATLGGGMGRVTGVPGTRSIDDTPTLTNIQVLDSTIPCDESMLVTVAVNGNNECLIRSAADGDDDSSSSPPITGEDSSSTNTDATMNQFFLIQSQSLCLNYEA